MLWLGGVGPLSLFVGTLSKFGSGYRRLSASFFLSVEGIRPEIMDCGAVLECMQPRSPGCGQGFRPAGKIRDVCLVLSLACGLHDSKCLGYRRRMWHGFPPFD